MCPAPSPAPAVCPRSLRDSGARSGLALGSDLVEVAQVAHAIETFGDRYLRRIYTPGELAYCLAQTGDPAPHLAARFAAKEATMKALQQGDEGVDWRSVDVHRRGDGGCDIVLRGGARMLAERLGVGVLSVSMSHDGGYASAIVIGERRAERHYPSRITRKRPRGAYER